MTAKVLPWAQVSLRPLDAILAETFRQWQNDPDIRNRTIGSRFPVQLGNVAQWQEGRALENGKRSVSFSIFHEETGIGAVFLNDLDWVHGSADLGIYIGDTTLQGRGIGHCACTLILDYAFHGINLRRISLRVLQTNKPACDLYEALGFTMEGMDRNAYLLHGQPINVIRFGLLAEDYVDRLPASANRVA